MKDMPMMKKIKATRVVRSSTLWSDWANSNNFASISRWFYVH